MKNLFFLLLIIPFVNMSNTGQSTPLTAAFPLDTVRLKAIIQHRADSAAFRAVEVVDSLLAPCVLVFDRVDYDKRPNGSVYAWIGYFVVKGKDTVDYRLKIKKIK